LGERLQYFLKFHQVNSAHNGFLEVYLGLGLVGLFLFLGAVLSALGHALRTFSTDVIYGQLRLLMIFVFLAYNMTETATLLTSLMFFVFLLVAMQAPQFIASDAHVDDALGTSADMTRGEAVPRGTHS
jgi:O-antigen ligase